MIRKGALVKIINLLTPILFFVIFVLLWHILTSVLGLPAYVLPSPINVAIAFQTHFLYLLRMSMDTLRETIVGFGLSAIVGISLAVLAAYSKSIRTAIYPALVGFNSFPKSALAPLMLVWFGLGWESKAITAFIISFFPVFVNSVTGLSEIETDLMDLTRTVKTKEWRVFLKIRLPNASVYVIDGLRIALPLAMVGAIIGEFVGGNTGLGYVILYSGSQLNTPTMFAAILLTVILSVTLFGIITMIDKIVIKWRPSKEKR